MNLHQSLFKPGWLASGSVVCKKTQLGTKWNSFTHSLQKTFLVNNIRCYAPCLQSGYYKKCTSV